VITLLSVEVEMPRSLVMDPPLTDCEFEVLCAANDLLQIERTREGEIKMQAPAGGFSSRGNAEINGQLYVWWNTHRRGSLSDSSGGFFLSDGSVLSPDAAYLVPEKLQGLTKHDLTGFPRLCPDFVIELLSLSDSLPKTREKMERWIENGATLGWLIDPYQKKVYIYGAGREAAVVSGKIALGSGPVEGFTFDLDRLWRCYEI
jgi:Uma2 family endonuclease